MSVIYPQRFCLRYFGKISSGPAQGDVLKGDLLECLFIGKSNISYAEQQEYEANVDNWIERAKADKKNNPDLTVEVCTRGYNAKTKKVDTTVLFTF